MNPISNSSGIRDYLLALVFGAMAPLSLAPFNFWMAGIVSTAMLTLLLARRRVGQCYRRAFFFGSGMFAVGSSWVYVSIHTYGHASMLLAGSLTGLFVVALAAIFAIPFLLYAPLAKRGVAATLWAFPSIWVLGELWRGWVLTGFPWLYLGYAHLDTWLAGWAPIGGVYLLSFMTAFMGAWIALLLEWKSAKFAMQLGMVIILAIWLAGSYLRREDWTQDVDKPLAVTLVQPNQPINDKWDSEQAQIMIDKIIEQTREYWDDSDIVVWPESAIPLLKYQARPLLDALTRIATDHKAALITGIPTTSVSGDEFYNAVISIGDNSHGEYRKEHLVPIGEYVPFENLLRGAIDFFDLPMSDFSPGSRNQPNLLAKGVRVGTAICYEIVYPFMVGERAANSQILLTVSNDTWFGDSIGPWQHLQMAQMRAMENGKPVIRATNSGLTALIDSRGKLEAVLPRFIPGELNGFVRPRKGTTPFQRQGLAISLILAGFGLSIALLCKKDRPKIGVA